MSGRLTTVHVRINDAATGQPTPVRLRITDSEGRYYPPLGRLAEFATARGVDVGGNLLLEGRAYAFVEGACEIPLPSGPITVEATKGPEYRPLHQTVSLPQGKLALRLMIERWCNWRETGWYSGDTWAHFLSPQAALLEAAAEDLAVVNLLATPGPVGNDTSGTSLAIPNILEFSGQKPAAEAPGHLVAVNTLNRHRFLGTLALLNCHRPVYPLSFGEPNGVDDWALDEWCDQCHRKGGLVIGHGLFGHDADHPHGELLANLIHGKVDAVQRNAEFKPPESSLNALAPWYDLLDCGIRVPLLGGSGKQANVAPLGRHRTYARLRPGESLTYRTWIEAVRAGRTFATNGPLLTCNVNGQDPGAVLDLPTSHPVVHVRAEAQSLTPIDRVEIVANRTVVASGTTSVETEVTLPQGGWITARCLAAKDRTSAGPMGAQSSPVYVQVDGKPRPVDPTIVASLISRLEKTLMWIAKEANCPTDRDRERLANVVRTAQQRLGQRTRSYEPDKKANHE